MIKNKLSSSCGQSRLARVLPVINSRLNSITRKRKMWHELKVRIQANEMYKQVGTTHSSSCPQCCSSVCVCMPLLLVTHRSTCPHTRLGLRTRNREFHILQFDIIFFIALSRRGVNLTVEKAINERSVDLSRARAWQMRFVYGVCTRKVYARWCIRSTAVSDAQQLARFFYRTHCMFFSVLSLRYARLRAVLGFSGIRNE